MNFDDNINPEDLDFGDFSEYEGEEISAPEIYPEEAGETAPSDPYAGFETFDTYEGMDGGSSGGGFLSNLNLSNFKLPDFANLDFAGENRPIVLLFSAVMILLLCCWACSIPMAIWVWNNF